MNHIIRSQQFDRKTIKQLFTSADSLQKKNGSTLRGKLLASLFYEPSTRTRFSFESAMIRLGGHVISTDNAGEFSSASKGETLEDTIRVLGNYVNAIVLRHPDEGASERAAAVSTVPIINAGDGRGQHPTQALLDLYTIQKEHGSVDGLHVVFVGDLKNGRTVHSLSYLLGKYKDVSITYVSPPALRLSKDIKEYLERHAVRYEECTSWDEALPVADVIYQTRVQKERFKKMTEYEKYKGKYILTGGEMERIRKDAIVMHPLPRVGEIAHEVDAYPQAAYFRQVGYGLYVRMALLKMLLG